jgi:hypothetical protein
MVNAKIVPTLAMLMKIRGNAFKMFVMKFLKFY